MVCKEPLLRQARTADGAASHRVTACLMHKVNSKRDGEGIHVPWHTGL